MKNLILILSSVIILITACNPGPDRQQASHELQWSDNGADSVVYVNTPDGNGGFWSYYMRYMLFRQLFSNGGYRNVNNYYNTHRSYFAGDNVKYQSYTAEKPSYRSNTAYSSGSRSYSSPSRRQSSGQSIGHSIFSSRSSGYSSPSRSSSSSSYRSYSSPSRSSYSSSRSYSTPSRSFSSRSYSSPSRH